MYGIPGTKNIHKRTDGGFVLVKTINGKHVHLGRGKTLIIALMKLDWCRENNWQPYPIKRYHIRENPSGTFTLTKKKRINGVSRAVYNANFNTYEEAEKEARLFEKYGWDLEEVCNNSEEVLAEGEQWLKGVKLKSTFQKRIRNDYFLAKRGGIL